jgi:hypothetical protein
MSKKIKSQWQETERNERRWYWKARQDAQGTVEEERKKKREEKGKGKEE